MDYFKIRGAQESLCNVLCTSLTNNVHRINPLYISLFMCFSINNDTAFRKGILYGFNVHYIVLRIRICFGGTFRTISVTGLIS